ncbi:uncharacterized protein TrAFT101_005772 [Trichoderma asperellum]|uniref:RING-type domain-containing protein n=1 Tax=Trichoderma asperellum (strain ATCC 204424 / CBS 433.97 / NBRC 101777) TaxID=1042311 RepID=A0A2T3Z721_TRIA4|nr:hypothetical protein M441DRAFT_140736 [Trichoderma asperellum CBS 433.97]PTB40596.1 hypothetical protein M441DRAFT_140736 [Trichoderma asperellum CBS 433.97]UKZ90774.1 hypothetical protein TrAFT101_005772 [Trichoderma asperellum]
MAVIDQVLGEVAHIVVRAATTTTHSATATSSDVTSPQTAIPSNTNSSNNNNKSSGSSSPLLFFVALGFGVVFTNLWIIVGVKYCFRYNARNRARNMTNEDGEPITLENMPRPHRRRREKKLMTMDEVNDKFPMMKYKTWVSERARDGLPTAGGVGTPSRPNSIHQVDLAVPEVAKKERTSTEVRAVDDIASPVASPATEAESVIVENVTKDDENKKDKKDNKDTAAPVGETSEEDGPVMPHDPLKRTSSEEEDEEDDEDDDEHITAAVPPELLNTSGDTCAICIDTLEDDDDVRGLTCGHTFHAVCVDPWLTSRRACCPLCKADYYVPKPRPNPENDPATASNANLDPHQNSRMNLPASLTAAFFRSSGGRSRNNRNRNSNRSSNRNSNRNNGRSNNNNSSTRPSVFQFPIRRRVQSTAIETRIAHQQNQTTETAQPAAQGTLLSSVRHAFRFGRSTEAPSTTNAAPAVTPSQLEAGTQPPATST